VLNNWYPGENLSGQARKGYTQTDVNMLVGLAFQAWREWQPIDVRASATGQVYRRIGYGPLLDVFMLDMRSYNDPTPMTGRPPTAAGSWAPNRRSG
jgi:alkaline phosphatase D